MQRIIDASQFETFSFCPQAWFNTYVKGYFAGSAKGEGPLVLGSLFHAALEAFLLTGEISVPDEEIKKLEANKDVVLLAHKLVHSYVRTYPPSEFPLVSCEEPLFFPLVDKIVDNWKGVSKIDYVTRLDEDIEVQLDVDIFQTLPKGVWGIEHKTRQKRNREGWAKHWTVRPQAAFEILAMQANYEDVRGILVNTVEYVKPYQAVKTCKSCSTKSEVRTWKAIEKNIYKCPVCNKEDEYKPRKQTGTETPPVCYRLVVTRSQENLEFYRELISRKAKEMNNAWESDSTTPNVSNCVRPPQYFSCDYYDACHNNTTVGLTIKDDPYDYIGLK